MFTGSLDQRARMSVEHSRNSFGMFNYLIVDWLAYHVSRITWCLPIESGQDKQWRRTEKGISGIAATKSLFTDSRPIQHGILQPCFLERAIRHNERDVIPDKIISCQQNRCNPNRFINIYFVSRNSYCLLSIKSLISDQLSYDCCSVSINQIPCMSVI